MCTNEYFNITHRLTMLGMNEISVLVVDVKEVLEHAQYETWDGKHLGEGTEP